MTRFFISLFLLSSALTVVGQAGDTTIVQTYTFEEQNNPETAYDSPGRRWFTFPSSDNGVEYQKILMYHTLKCFEDGTAGNLGYPCGEWDYLSYNYLFEHTGAYDSNFVWTPHYKLNNADFQQAELVSTPIYDYHAYEQTITVVDEVLEESSYAIGAAGSYDLGPLLPHATARSQYLLLAQELLDAGLTAGEIERLSLSFDGATAVYHDLRIRCGATTATELSGFQSTAMTTVYHQDIAVPGAGDFVFHFSSPYVWDGSSNLLLEFSYTNPASTLPANVAGDTTPFASAVTSAGNDRYILFNGQDEVVVPAGAFTGLDQSITISFWLNGTPEFQPENGTCFEAANSQNQRVLNTHLPWSNGRVYWDAGWDGGYDRIDKAAVASNYEGQWNHWAFTKNATTGSMQIYLNGVLWHSGTDKDNAMQDIVRFSIGAATTWSNYYRGAIDEFAVWNTDLDAATISEWMAMDLNESHPAWSNLLFYYSFDDANDQPVADLTDNGNAGWKLGDAPLIGVEGADLFRNAVASSWRPAFTLYNGIYATHTEVLEGVEAVAHPAVSLAEYSVSNYQPQLLNVDYYYLPSFSYSYDAQGNVIDSVYIDPDFAITNDSIWYYQAPFEIVHRYELGRFITPYGIQLDLEDGWTWVFDVTDFAPLLRDEVELEAGNWQELLDLKFLFIEGTPAREVQRIENVWQGNWGLGNFDQNVTARTLEMQEGEEGVKLRTTLTGHGFGNDANNCGEFCYNTHRLEVDGQVQWQWEIMQDCDKNPLFPQGGTWIYARSAWCPGAPGRTEEFELTPYAEDGTVSIDYDITYDPYGNYVTETQAIFYGPILHAHDPEIEMITAPSDWKIHSRWNPMCDNPRFILRNKGSEPLTHLEVHFRVDNGPSETFVWTGNLGFMESEEVELTSANSALWYDGDNATGRFYLDLGTSNDGADQNTSNNHAESTFQRPPVYSYMPDDEDDNRLIIVFKTNSAYWETRYTLYDMYGNIVYARDDFNEANEVYRDTVALNQGCYLFHLYDSDGDGMSFFANDDGNGYCKFDRVSGSDFISFERDFGREITHSFFWQTNLVSVEEAAKDLTSLLLYPNPAGEHCVLVPQGFDRTVRVRVMDASGRVVDDRIVRRQQATERIEWPLQDYRAGIYEVIVTDENHHRSTRLVKH